MYVCMHVYVCMYTRTAFTLHAASDLGAAVSTV